MEIELWDLEISSVWIFPSPLIKRGVAMATLKEARAAKNRTTQQLAKLPNVVGIGLVRDSGGGYAIKVNVDKKPAPGKIPQQIDNVGVVVEVVGKLKKRV